MDCSILSHRHGNVRRTIFRYVLVFFNMDLEKYPNLKKVVYNDFNPLNYNLFKCVQNPSELQRVMDEIEVQQVGVDNASQELKEKFVSFQSEIFGEGFKVEYPDYVTAAKYVYVLSQVFSGSKPETSSFIDLKGKYRSKYLAFRDKLSKPNWVEHFTKITHVENLDFQDVIEKYDSPTTYIYMDPPYWKTENYYSNHDFDREDHERLANVLNKVQGNLVYLIMILSCYTNGFLKIVSDGRKRICEGSRG